MMTKVLVVGGAGYVGGAVTDELLNRRIPFTVYDNLTYENHYLKPVDFIYGDVRDRAKLGTLLPQYSHVIWLAALVGDGACAIKPDLTYQINQEPVEWLSKHYDGRILFSSTCSVYGANDQPVTETSPINPLSVYAQTKLGAEQYLRTKNAVIFRLGTAFGIPDTTSRVRMDLAINYMTMNAMTQGKLTIFGGNQWRPFVHVRDIAAAMGRVLETDHHGIFNLATQNITIDTVGALIQQETGCEIEVKGGEFKDPRNYNADTTKARAHNILSGSATPFDIRYGIREIKELTRSRRVRDLGHEFYSNQKYLLRAIAHYENGFSLGAHNAPSAPPVAAPTPLVNTPKAESTTPEIRVIEGGLGVDDRGEVAFVNNFTFEGVKRFYMVSNHRSGFIRAWHAHQHEGKYVMVVAGAALVGAVRVTDFEHPDKNVTPYRTVLSSRKPSVLYIPPGYANGAMSLTKDTKIIYFSTASLEESKGDDYRYPSHYWDVWNIEER